MQLSKLFNTTNPNMKYIWFMFLPILVVVAIQYAVIIGDVIFLFAKNILSSQEVDKDATIEFIMNSDFKQPMNQAYMTLFQYLIYILVFGIWYYKAFCKDANIFGSSDFNSFANYVKDKLLTIKSIFIIIAGYMAQLFVDGILTLAQPHFQSSFDNYGKMVDSITGAKSSFVMIFAVILVAPIGEELLFRGLIQSYGLKNFAPVLAIGLQGLIFGLYHGNVIQGIYAFFMGVVLGIVTYKLGSIIPAILLHVSINASLLLVPEILYIGTGRTIATTIVTGAIFVVMIWLVVRKTNKDME
ncbi:MAG: CPBP family intramembrane metalloprotease [Lachnospiraceae bacterium]|nr:CPBP family intramembrane metalloprotease [Lachnospiraceae bacterium]